MSNLEYSDGGPLKRDVSSYPAGGGVGLLVNNFLTEELNQGTDSGLAQDEVFTKVCGPWFTYLNSVPTSLTDKAQAGERAVRRCECAGRRRERGAGLTSWFIDPDYPLAAGRGTVKGQLKLADSGNVNPVVAGTWVGLEQEPNPVGGERTISKSGRSLTNTGRRRTRAGISPSTTCGPARTTRSSPIGQGIAGTFQSQNLQNGNPPIELDIPNPPMAPIVVTAGATTSIRVRSLDRATRRGDGLRDWLS